MVNHYTVGPFAECTCLAAASLGPLSPTAQPPEPPLLCITRASAAPPGSPSSGALADRYGGKGVLAAGVAAWSLTTCLTPPAAYIGLPALIGIRCAALAPAC